MKEKIKLVLAGLGASARIWLLRGMVACWLVALWYAAIMLVLAFVLWDPMVVVDPFCQLAARVGAALITIVMIGLSVKRVPHGG